MKRVIDKPYFSYSAYTATTTGICVKCPTCHGLGIVSADNDHAYFKCTNCGLSKTKERRLYRYDVHNLCKECKRHYRVDITDRSKQHFHKLHVACPYCGHVMSGELHKTKEDFLMSIGEINNSCEPYFNLELWFLTSFCGKAVWAINRDHLTYLINYLSANLREKPNESMLVKTQADHLPTFMKTAKNRDGIVKLLKEMDKNQSKK